MIVIGIDPHKASVTAAALSSASATLGHRRLATTAKTGAQLISWAAEWPDRLWAVEGAAGLGHGVAQQLVAAGERVVDVPAKLANATAQRAAGTGTELRFRWVTDSPPDERGVGLVRFRLNFIFGSELRGWLV